MLVVGVWLLWKDVYNNVTWMQTVHRYDTVAYSQILGIPSMYAIKNSVVKH